MHLVHFNKIKKNNENLEFKVDKILRDYDLKNGIIDKLIDSKLSQYKSMKNEINKYSIPMLDNYLK